MLWGILFFLTAPKSDGLYQYVVKHIFLDIVTCFNLEFITIFVDNIVFFNKNWHTLL